MSAKNTEKAEKVNVRFVTPSWGREVGATKMVDADAAAHLIANGHAVPTTEAQAEKVAGAVESIDANAAANLPA